MIKVMYIRKGKTIKNLETNSVSSFDSINKAKRESVLLQRANGGLGKGSVVNIK